MNFPETARVQLLLAPVRRAEGAAEPRAAAHRRKGPRLRDMQRALLRAQHAERAHAAARR